MGGNKRAEVSGVNIREYPSGKKSIVIHFMFRGVECRETLKGIEATNGNLKYAVGLKAEIERKIAQDNFTYTDYFPCSPKAKKFGHVVSKVTIATLLDEFMSTAEKSMEASSLATYRSSIKIHLKPTFGSTPVKELTPAQIRTFIKSLTLTLKSIRNLLIPLRHVLEGALNDDLIEKNPMSRIVIEKLVAKEQASSDYVIDPFNEAERMAIIQAAKGQAKNLIQFTFYSGLRPSELIALEWGDVDWLGGTIRVQRAVVNRHKKGTKTKAGTRDIILLPPALAALKAQKQYTFLAGWRIFHHPVNMTPLEHDDQIRRTMWIRELRLAGVRYRNPYQMRHTYASMLLSAGENPLWVATQMGHVDTEMITRIYGKWIPENKKGGYTFSGDWGAEGDKIALLSHLKNGTE
jgi:integrase